MFSPVLDTVYIKMNPGQLLRNKISRQDNHKKINILQCGTDQRARWRHIDMPIVTIFPLTQQSASWYS